MPHDLLEGFKKFRQKDYEDEGSLMPQLVEEGQNPDYFVISCIDSRSNPATIFKAPSGTFFTFKAMGAIVHPYETGTALSASLKFAIEYQNVSQIIVVGHTKCGAIDALINNIQDEEISSFLEVAQTGLEIAKGKAEGDQDLNRRTEEQIVLQSRENLKSYPVVGQAIEDGKVEILAWLFDMEQGEVFEYKEDQDQFINITNFSSEDSEKAVCGCC